MNDIVSSIHTVAISPDGSWIIMFGDTSYQILRVELAPVEKIWVDNALAITSENYDSFDWKINYVIMKPGRAAKVEQNWDIWAMLMGIPTPPSILKNYCSGDMQYTYNHDLVDGNVIISGSRDITAPSCTNLFGASFELFYFESNLKSQLSGKKLSIDEVPLSSISITP